jgi:hypothetical protein
MEANKPRRAIYRAPVSLPTIQLPIDWSDNGTLTYPMDGNDQYGDCMYAAACHLDNTFTFNATGTASVFNQTTLIQDYKTLSGGDNGLDESELVPAWQKGLAGVSQATILDSLDIDVTNPALVASAMYLFGGIFFMLSVPNRWINNSATGSVWDAPAMPNPMNGHGVCWVGTDANGRYRLITWGTYVWLTPAGVEACDPSGFVVFSDRWISPKTGLAPNGFSRNQLAALWAEAGGKTIAPSTAFPDPWVTLGS